jgi:hypothetical protein
LYGDLDDLTLYGAQDPIRQIVYTDIETDQNVR